MCVRRFLDNTKLIADPGGRTARLSRAKATKKEVRKNTPMGDRPGACPQRGGHRRAWISAWATLAVALCSRVALAAPHDDGAKRLIQKAMYQDYVETNFAESEKGLQEALALCQAATDCSPGIRARVLLDLGVVEFVLQRPDEGRAHFARAVQEDPKIILEPDFSTPELVKEFAAAKGGAPAATPEPSTDAEPATPEVAPPPVPGKTVSPDCPPDFPGCANTANSCTSNEECGEGLKCIDGSCSAGDQAEDEASKPYKKNWLTLAFQENLLILPSAGAACTGGQKYTCFDSSNGAYYAGSPDPSRDDAVLSGVVPSTMEILAGFDRALSRNVALGLRAGYILGGGPTRPGASAFVPVHAEGRVMYWFGKNPLSRKGFRFYLVLGSGIGEIDGRFTIDVFKSKNPSESGNPYSNVSTNEDAWTKTGTGFAALGPGIMYAITPVTGITLEVKFIQTFPTVGEALGLQLGYSYGL